jgi:hypothetical protein
METSTIDSQIKKNGLISGLVLGAVLFVLGLFAYYIMISATSFWTVVLVPGLVAFIVPVVISIFMSLDMRKKIGGYWSLKQATTGIFIMFIMCFVVQTIARDAIFAKFIEPDMVTKTENAIIDATTSKMESSGVEQSKIDDQTAKMHKQFDDQKNVTIGKRIQGYGVSIVLLFVLALIFGAIFKKEPPLFDVIDPATDPTA